MMDDNRHWSSYTGSKSGDSSGSSQPLESVMRRVRPVVIGSESPSVDRSTHGQTSPLRRRTAPAALSMHISQYSPSSGRIIAVVRIEVSGRRDRCRGRGRYISVVTMIGRGRDAARNGVGRQSVSPSPPPLQEPGWIRWRNPSRYDRLSAIDTGGPVTPRRRVPHVPRTPHGPGTPRSVR